MNNAGLGWYLPYEESAEQLTQRVDEASEFFVQLVEMLYSDRILDRIAVQKKIEDVAFTLGAKIPDGDLTIARKRSGLMSCGLGIF